MYLPPPGNIVIIGAGPIGLEAALYARYLGYAVDIFERGRAAENVLRHGDAKLATPFVLNASPLGLAALAAQDEAFRPPQADEVLTAREWVERYLRPLAESDLIVDGLREQTTVVNIQRITPGDAPPSAGEDDDDDTPPPPTLRVHWQVATGEAFYTDANVVIDCSGPSQAGQVSGAEIGDMLQAQRADPSAGGGAAALLTTEPNFYILGTKLGESGFTFAHGLGQIRDLFTLIGDRAGLNLYGTMARAE